MRQHRRRDQPDPDIFTQLNDDPRFPVSVAGSVSGTDPDCYTIRYTIEYALFDPEPDAVIKPRTVTHTYTFSITK